MKLIVGQLPRTATTPAGNGTENLIRATGRILLVSNRLPMTARITDCGLSMVPSDGGLASALRAIHERPDSCWIGWPGPMRGLRESDAFELQRELRERRILTVSLDVKTERAFYEKLSNGVLWPVLHDRLERVASQRQNWHAFEDASICFARTVVDEYRDGDMIWIHDYQLLRVPALVRERIPEATIGFFLHTPFPSPEIFSTLPVRRVLLEGMLGADLIGFHTPRYRQNFLDTVEREFGPRRITSSGSATVDAAGRRVETGVFPVGIDCGAFGTESAPREAIIQTLDLRASAKRILLGIDRLDYTKGIIQRLLAYRRVLERHPGWREHIQLIQVAVPSRGAVAAYRRFRYEVERLVARINGQFSTPGWTPIRYLYQSLTRDKVIALYRAADLMLVTPLRDGMNLVAKEFIASRTDGDGVLILSEFAGASEELRDALVINPYDVDALARTMSTALTMPRANRRMRMARLRARTAGNDVHRWTDAFLGALREAVGAGDRVGPLDARVGLAAAQA